MCKNPIADQGKSQRADNFLASNYELTNNNDPYSNQMCVPYRGGKVKTG